METLKSKLGWEIVEEEWTDFKGPIFRQRPANVVDLLENTVRKYPDRVGFISGNTRLTYREFNRTVNRMAAGLQKWVLKKGDPVALLLGVQLEFPVSFFALMKLGALAVPLNTRFKGQELAYEINDSESRFLIVDEEYWPYIASVRQKLTKVEAIFFVGSQAPPGTLPFLSLQENEAEALARVSILESDDAAILYTSGTTGRPKGALLHHRGLTLTAMLVSDFVLFQPEDRMVCCIPLFHITGLACIMLPPIFSGVACVYLKQFKTKDFLETLSREKVTHYLGVVNVIWLMVNHPDFDQYNFYALKTALLGGSFATEEMIREIFRKLPQLRISVGYGLTESFAIISSTPYEDALRKIKAVGQLLPLMEARIIDEEGREQPPGSSGEILLRGPKIFKGYWKKPEATETTLRDGWLHTGDIGKIDSEGFIYLLDRKKDMINRGGEKIYSLEVENVLSGHSKVLEVAVVGVPDRVMGEAVKACIALKPGQTADPDELKQFCAACLADYKVPKFIEFLESLPRNPAGKVIKKELRTLPEKEPLSRPFR